MAQISSLQNFVSNAVDTTCIRLLRKAADFDDASQTFHPDMAHQIFGEEENIFGYRDLRVDVMFAAGPLDIYFKVNYSKRVEDLNTEGLKADNVEKTLTDLIEDGCFYTNKDEYLKIVESKNASFRPFGEKVDSFETSAEGGAARSFEVYLCTVENKEYLKFHARLETLSFWFVDAFCRIEHDPLWMFFTIYERYSSNNNETRYATVGYLTVYQYYSYPNNTRPRVSQVLILPPFQKLGIATRLIEHTIFNYFVSNEKVADITYEEPNDVIQHIRSVVDAKRCKTLPSFAEKKLLLGFSKDMLREAKERFKITPKQCRVVYEILRLGITNTDNPEDYRQYRIEVKKRLNLNYSKQRRDLLRAQKRGVDVTAAFCGLPSVLEQMESLSAWYKEVENVYAQVLKKLLLLS